MSVSGRLIFSESERVCLQELIIKYKINVNTTFGAGCPYNNKKKVWARLTEEYNSIETNSKRTELQLRKCWDNMKTRKKQLLALEKKERMKTGGGSFQPSVPMPDGIVDEVLSNVTDIELPFVIDSDSVLISQGNLEGLSTITSTAERDQLLNAEGEEQSLNAEGVDPLLNTEEVNQSLNADTSSYSRSGAHTNGERRRLFITSPQIQGKNYRAQIIRNEYAIRKANYLKTAEQEEELHKLKVEEQKWLIKAAQEQYRCNRTKREEAEISLNEKLNKNTNLYYVLLIFSRHCCNSYQIRRIAYRENLHSTIKRIALFINIIYH